MANNEFDLGGDVNLSVSGDANIGAVGGSKNFGLGVGVIGGMIAYDSFDRTINIDASFAGFTGSVKAGPSVFSAGVGLGAIFGLGFAAKYGVELKSQIEWSKINDKIVFDGKTTIGPEIKIATITEKLKVSIEKPIFDPPPVEITINPFASDKKFALAEARAHDRESRPGYDSSDLRHQQEDRRSHHTPARRHATALRPARGPAVSAA